MKGLNPAEVTLARQTIKINTERSAIQPSFLSEVFSGYNRCCHCLPKAKAPMKERSPAKESITQNSGL